MAGFIKLLTNKWYPPQPCTQSFEGKTVLVTGTTGGLGFEAVKQLAALNASTLIITGRSQSRAEDVKKQVQDWLTSTKSTSKTNFIPLALDMSSHDMVDAFLSDLAKHTDQLDAALLNAGTIQSIYTSSSDGYESTIQVNTLSTIYLGIRLLPLLEKRSITKNTISHLTFVSSGTSIRVPEAFVTQYHSTDDPLMTISQKDNFPPGSFGGSARYGQSKLLLEYAARHLASSMSAEKQQQVIVGTVCPGLCQSDLARNFDGWSMTVFKFVLMTFFARTAEQGVNTYLTGLNVQKDGHGKLWRHDRFEPDDESNWPVVASSEGKELSDRVWKEVKEMVEKWDKDALNSL